MRWKNLSTWAKGGLIAVGINLFLIFLYRTLVDLMPQLPYDHPIAFIAMPSFIVTDLIYWGANSLAAIIITSSIFYFLVGAIIGLIIDKIKSKKSKEVKE